MNSPAKLQTPLERAQAALAVQRKATAIYQMAFHQACDNLIMMGRTDIANAVANAVLKAIQATPQQPQETNDDDLAG